MGAHALQFKKQAGQQRPVSIPKSQIRDKLQALQNSICVHP